MIISSLLGKTAQKGFDGNCFGTEKCEGEETTISEITNTVTSIGF